MQAFIALIVGLVFDIGLIVSGMTDPSKVTGFIDLAGRWDPSLGLVMGGAILVGILAGYCPGPALASLASGSSKPLIFSAAMMLGMVIFALLERLPSRRKQAAYGIRDMAENL